jgi:hypothetical protein
MANEIVPSQMSKCLKEIHRLQALIEWRCTRDDILELWEPIKKDIEDLKAAIEASDRVFQVEGKKSNATRPSSERAIIIETKG